MSSFRRSWPKKLPSCRKNAVRELFGSVVGVQRILEKMLSFQMAKKEPFKNSFKVSNMVSNIDLYIILYLYIIYIYCTYWMCTM